MSSLLEDLTRVAQYITDEKLRKTLVDKDKDKPGERGGIGTPATRDEIIKTLFERGFLEYRREGKKQFVVSTGTGRELYDCLPDTARFPDMTALWHDQQLEIEKGERGIDSFIDDLIAYLGAEIARILDNGLSLNIEKHPCPSCGKAMMRKIVSGKSFWGCLGYPGCKTTLPDDNGKPGRRVADKPRPSVSEKHACTKCCKGLVRRSGKKEGSYFWGCSGYPDCKSVYPDIDGKPNYTGQKEK